MEPILLIIPMTAMILTYKLISKAMDRRKYTDCRCASHNHDQKRGRKRKVHDEPVDLTHAADEMIYRLKEMQRRVGTLEEIISAEQAERSHV